MLNKQTIADVGEIAESTLRLKRYVVACVSWLRGGGRGKHWMLDAKLPLKEVLEMMPVPMLTIDYRSRITFANAETMKMFGYSREELAGASVRILFPIRALYDNHLTVEDDDVENGTSGASRTQVVVAQRRDGLGLQAKISITKYMDNNQILKITAIPERGACGEVDRSRDELEHLARVSSLGELAGSLAHELKQPLTAILFNAQAAQKFMGSETANAAELHDALEDIIADSCRANEVIQKIRTLVRKGDIDLRPLDVGGVVRDIALLVHSDAIARGVRTSFDISNKLPMVCGDRVQLQQVVLNLLLNAFDAVKECAPAERVVEVTVREEPDEGLRITVKDWGVGLTVDKMHKIFRAFFTTKPQGLGLGLSISRTIITGHGGRIWAENNVGKGASFHITLPRASPSRQDSGPRAP
ncbi:Sensor protein FixL [Paraburkholderia domus]|jgi:PAS domain S-box|uniref:histidine kinase n=2 Tax=Paraburkholderia domus TaxID=2793075 RepID=A0A9N8MM05_9BURK|nr:ATP-binding protein [Paraburkholderia domus]MBK5049269.1 PAS domain S-box protein [Burkholderia sp. R-70006]MBK5060238.1 PAS domain S-box protein [Burkholderia sp. R-70199]MBK5085130.1 PAS domain S-box protein [Burkholderia sp. R-69927]MBK5118502.1 PAS domain S-box protein [Burkholderia sp. R-69980]MBK5164340.1 PAS domain S-box protein [Burkholderia sp. R-70211]